jgi:hypothetical protein
LAAIWAGRTGATYAQAPNEGSAAALSRIAGPCAGRTQALSTTTRTYSVNGRARILLVWTGRREIGDAHISWKTGPDARRLELLIGTDPARAPRKLNRWGYIAETVCGDQAHVLGLMTPVDEESVEEAEESLANGSVHTLKAVRASVDRQSVKTERFRLPTTAEATYRDLGARLKALPPHGAGRTTPRPANVDTGFLVSVDALIRDAIARPRAPGARPSAAPRRYLYQGRVYELTMREAKDVATMSAHGTQYARLIDAEFALRNTVNGDVTTFRMTFGTTGDLTAVPVRIAYKPRWWLEVELTLNGEVR